MTPVQVAPHLVEALSIFKSELTTHLDWLKDSVSSLGQASDQEAFAQWLAANSKQIENRFHVLKGSAGFLGLTAIRDVSQKGEKIFKPGSPFLNDGPALRQEFTRAVSGLAEAAAGLD